jgi:hypothetical protein
MDPVTAGLITAAVSGAGQGMLGAASNRSQNKANKALNKAGTRFQEKKYQLIDDLINSIAGNGRFSSLFNADEAAFQKSFVDPAKAMFRNQIAPQIQQQSIAGGMQGSSTLDDQLLRAGVDLDQMLNQQYMQFQNQGNDRAMNAISGALGTNAPYRTASPTGASAMFGAASGFLGSQGFNDFSTNAMTANQKAPNKEGFA